MESYRCFIAVDLPLDVKDYLAYIQQQFREWPAKIKWVEPENFHLTLKFLGDTSLEKIPSVKNVLQGIADISRSWEVALGDLGAFPGRRNPKVIWVGIKDMNNGLVRLWEDIERELHTIGFATEKKTFSPHLTVGRVKDSLNDQGIRNVFDETVRSIQKKAISFPINEIKLMRSVLKPLGPEYSCLASFYLQEH